MWRSRSGMTSRRRSRKRTVTDNSSRPDGVTRGHLPAGCPSLAGEFAGMPHGRAWTGAQPHLVSAAAALSAGQHEASTAALAAADGILERLLADQEAASRLA